MAIRVKCKDVNLFNYDNKIDIQNIYSDTIDDICMVTNQICKIWNTHSALVQCDIEYLSIEICLFG